MPLKQIFHVFLSDFPLVTRNFKYCRISFPKNLILPSKSLIQLILKSFSCESIMKIKPYDQNKNYFGKKNLSNKGFLYIIFKIVKSRILASAEDLFQKVTPNVPDYTFSHFFFEILKLYEIFLGKCFFLSLETVRKKFPNSCPKK